DERDSALRGAIGEVKIVEDRPLPRRRFLGRFAGGERLDTHVVGRKEDGFGLLLGLRSGDRSPETKERKASGDTRETMQRLHSTLILFARFDLKPRAGCRNFFDAVRETVVT